LETFNVQFPEGATAAEDGDTLIVRNTRSNLMRVELILAALSDAKGGALLPKELELAKEALFYVRARSVDID
jgi:hypothetical protein